MNIFEKASRIKLRFKSQQGALTAEQLWDLKLPALDVIAKSVHAELASVTTESFVATIKDTRSPTLELKMEVLKHVIAVKIAENEASKNAIEKSKQKQVLLAALDEVENAEVRSMGKDELRKKLAELD